MFRFLRFAGAVGIAIGLQVFVTGIHPSLPRGLDFVLVVALYYAFRCRPATSALLGSSLGLVQDSLSGGHFGLNGFATTFAAYTTSRIQERMVIHQNSQVLLLLLLAATLQQSMVAGLQFLLFRDAELPNALSTVILMATSSLIGTLLYIASQRFHSWHERRQALGRQRIRLED